MTTIAYHHKSKTIAWDGRSTTGDGVIMTDSAKKVHKKEGFTFWISGSVADRDLLIDCYLGSGYKRHIEGNGFAFDGIRLFVFGCLSGGLWVEEVEHDHSIGSGSNFALSAMRLGLGAKEAVEHAKTLDCYTGGEVHVMELE